MSKGCVGRAGCHPAGAEYSAPWLPSPAARALRGKTKTETPQTYPETIVSMGGPQRVHRT